MDKKIEIFILTHKEITESYDDSIYKPLLNGAVYNDKGFGYLNDNTGDNISKLNPDYSELTGQYWAWKNTDNDIIGFCHYRRWFIRNFKLDKLTKEDILKSLDEYDIILAKKMKLRCSHEEFILENLKKEGKPEIDEIGIAIRNVLEKYYPEYVEDYDDYLAGNYLHAFNMFISNRQLVDDYFKWLFDFLSKFDEEIKSSESPNLKRTTGYASERLLPVYAFKNNLKIKEYEILRTESPYPRLSLLYNKFPKVQGIMERLYSLVRG